MVIDNSLALINLLLKGKLLIDVEGFLVLVLTASEFVRKLAPDSRFLRFWLRHERVEPIREFIFVFVPVLLWPLNLILIAHHLRIILSTHILILSRQILELIWLWLLLLWETLRLTLITLSKILIHKLLLLNLLNRLIRWRLKRFRHRLLLYLCVTKLIWHFLLIFGVNTLNPIFVFFLTSIRNSVHSGWIGRLINTHFTFVKL